MPTLRRLTFCSLKDSLITNKLTRFASDWLRYAQGFFMGTKPPYPHRQMRLSWAIFFWASHFRRKALIFLISKKTNLVPCFSANQPYPSPACIFYVGETPTPPFRDNRMSSAALRSWLFIWGGNPLKLPHPASPSWGNVRLRGTPSRVRFAAPYSRALDRASPLRQINFLEGDAGGMFAFLLLPISPTEADCCSLL